MKHKAFLSVLALMAAIALAVCGTALAANASTSSLNAKNVNPSDGGNLVPGDRDSRKIKFWEIDEYKDWMKQQYSENQKLADSGDKSFYEKDAHGTYVCREWTQEDVDVLYAQWQEQLALMKQGYRFTKDIILPDGGALTGVFDPETWNANPSTAPGSIVITLPNGSTVELGPFDTSKEAAGAVEKYLKQQVAEGKLTQQEADAIWLHGAKES